MGKRFFGASSVFFFLPHHTSSIRTKNIKFTFIWENHCIPIFRFKMLFQILIVIGRIYPKLFPSNISAIISILMAHISNCSSRNVYTAIFECGVSGVFGTLIFEFIFIWRIIKRLSVSLKIRASLLNLFFTFTKAIID